MRKIVVILVALLSLTTAATAQKGFIVGTDQVINQKVGKTEVSKAEKLSLTWTFSGYDSTVTLAFESGSTAVFKVRGVAADQEGQTLSFAIERQNGEHLILILNFKLKVLAITDGKITFYHHISELRKREVAYNLKF